MNRTVQKNLLLDIAIGLAAGLVATKVTGFAQQAFYKRWPSITVSASPGVLSTAFCAATVKWNRSALDL